MVKAIEHIIGMAATTAVIGLLWLQAMAWSFPIPGNDAGRRGRAKTKELVGNRIDSILSFPLPSLSHYLSGTGRWVCGSLLWGGALYGATAIAWRLATIRRRTEPATRGDVQ